MISAATTTTILQLLSIDPAITRAEIDAMRSFLANGCTSPETIRILIDGDLLLSLSAAAKFLGMSRDNFRALAKEKVDGELRFTPIPVFGESRPRYSKLQLIKYSIPRSASSNAANPGYEIAC